MFPRKFRTRHIRKRYHQLLYRRAALVGAGLMFIALLLVGCMYVPWLQVRTVQVEGSQEERSGAVAMLAAEALEGRYFFVIPKKFILLYPKAQVVASVREAFPNFSSIKSKASIFSGLTIEVVERKPTSLWCGDVVADSDAYASECFYMDETGFIYERAPTPLPSLYMRFYGAIEAKPIASVFLSTQIHERFHALTNALKDAELPVESVRIADETDAELYLARGEKILISYNDEPFDIRDRLISVLESEPFKQVGAAKLEYIDLRFGNKVYYKMRE